MLSISVSHGLGLYLLGAYSFVDHREAHLNPSQKAVCREAVRQAIGVINYSRSRLGWRGLWGCSRAGKAESLPSWGKGGVGGRVQRRRGAP